MTKRIKNILSVLLLVLFASLNAYNAVFVHSHYVDNIQITHAHPFSASHTHSHAEYSILQSLSATAYVGAEESSIDSLTPPIVYIVQLPQVEHLYTSLIQFTALRAPPVSFVA